MTKSVKLEMVKHLQSLTQNVDEKAFLESSDNLWWISNKKSIVNMSPEWLSRRSSKEGLEFMIKIYSKYQLKKEEIPYDFCSMYPSILKEDK